MRPTNPFIQAASAGRNDLWRYLVTIIGSSALLLLVAGIVSLAAFLAAHALPRQYPGAPAILPPAGVLAATLVPYAGLILGLALGLRSLHQRSPRTLVRPQGRFHWGWLALSGGLWLVLSALGDGVMSLIFPGSYRAAFAPERFWPYAVVAVLLLPVQVAAEELWFRGYLTQGVGLAGGEILGWIGPAVLFGLLHGFNPEVTAYGALFTLPVYIAMGLLLGWVTLRSAGLEMALGLHLANNLYATLLVSAPVSALPGPSLFSMDQYHPVAALAINFAGMAIYALVAGYFWLRRGRGEAPG